MAFEFSKIKEGMAESNALVVDSLNLAFRWKHQGRTDFRYQYLKTVQSLAQSYKCGTVVITSDWGSSAYRKHIDPFYKDNRAKLREDQTEEEKMQFEEFFEEYTETLELLADEGYPVLRFQGVEADDIAAYIVKNQSLFGYDKIWLISSDRDWDLLVNESVSRFSYVTRKEVTLDNWGEHYNVTPEEYISFKCLTGDKGDNIPGIDGIGPKRAETLIKEYGSAYDIYDQLPLDSKYKYIVNLNNSDDRLLVNYELMDLITYCEAAIGSGNIDQIKESLVG